MLSFLKKIGQHCLSWYQNISAPVFVAFVAFALMVIVFFASVVQEKYAQNIQAGKASAPLVFAKQGTEITKALEELHKLPFEEDIVFNNNQFNSSFAWLKEPEKYEGTDPLLVIVIDDLGMSMSAVQQLLALDYPVSLAFWPHGTHTSKGAELAHQHQREVLVHLPMEPISYPATQPGPNALLKGLEAHEIASRVEQGIMQVPFAVGLNNHMGSSFTQDSQGIAIVLDVLEEWQFFILDSLTHPKSIFYDEAIKRGVPAVQRHIFLDAHVSPAPPLAMLKKAENLAKKYGYAIAIGHPLPETMAALKTWQHNRDTTVKLVRLQDVLSKVLGKGARLAPLLN